MILDTGTTYTGTVNCTAGRNTIYVKATDNAGNFVLSNAMDIYIDVNAPDTATLEDEVNLILTNGTSINGVGNTSYNAVITTSDAGADEQGATEGTDYTGIDSVRFVKIGNTSLGNNAIDGTYDSTTGKWTVEIPASAVTADGSATFEVKDKVGNTATFSLFQLQRDRTYPTVSMNVINDADTDDSENDIDINKTITISGTANDNQGIASVELEYFMGNSAPSATSTWIPYPNGNVTTNPTVWSVSVNTTVAPFATADGSTVYFRAVATDKAGNKGNSGSTKDTVDNPYGNIYGNAQYATLKISQDSDRPVIRLNAIPVDSMTSTNARMVQTKRVLGTISDDDGNGSSDISVYYSIGIPDPTTHTVSEWSDWSSNVYINGLIDFTMDVTDGSKDIRFMVIDKDFP